jgi:antitoxin ParD1/3/4
MRSTRQMSITLPVEMADSVRAKVARGDYASESEVIREGLRALEAQEEAIERWLRTEVIDICEEMEAYPERAISAADVRIRLERLHAETLKSRGSDEPSGHLLTKGDGDA